jgi:CheY-like chemotaxis protein
VLVVEDDPVVRTLVVKALSASYDAVEAVDGRAALEYIATEAPPDVIVADVTMPNVDGFTMTRALKADARTKKIPVLFLSARGLPRDVLESIAVGGCAYIQKPFAMDDLLDKVARAAEG